MSEPCHTPPHVFTALRGVQAPLAGSAVALSGYDSMTQTGTTRVAVAVGTAGVTKATAIVIPAADVPPADPPDGAVYLTAMGDNLFGNENFPVTGAAPQGPFTDDKQLCYWGLDDDDNVLERGAPITFAAVPNPCTTTVAATQAIWLTYTDDATVSVPQFGEHAQAGSPNIPYGVRFPNAATQVRVQGTGGPWAHDPAADAESGPGGRGSTDTDLAMDHRDKYKSGALKSISISGQSLPLNLLVGVREYLTHDTEATSEIAIGMDATFDKRPMGGMSDPVRLRLAMHDAYEWSNNHGTVTVTITWIV